MAKSSPKGQKTLKEKEKLLITSNFSFSLSVSKDLYCRHIKTRACLGKDTVPWSVILAETVIKLQ